MTLRAALLVVAITGASSAAAEPTVAIRLNGPVSNRLNLVVLGDGYTSSEMLKYSTDVDLMIIGLFRQEPYASYSNYFNVTRVDVVSNESGVDHPERGVARDTALGGTYNCGGVQRVICVNTASVNAVISRSVQADARDLVVVLVNDAEYGGSGGAVPVASTHPQTVDLLLHEMGHTLGLLADEYTDQPPTCNNAVEPPEVNASRESGSAVKWSYWIEASTPLPTTSTTNGVAGTYLGARYCTTGLYRPTFSSKMRALERPFEQINGEQLIKRFYNFAGPIDGASPGATTLTVMAGGTVDFSVSLQQPAHGLSVRWTVDGAQAGQQPSYRFSASGLQAGTHTVEAEVSDGTSSVRRDADGVLRDRRRWTVTVEGSTGNELQDAINRWRGR